MNDLIPAKSMLDLSLLAPLLDELLALHHWVSEESAKRIELHSHMALLFNMDEFFVKLENGGQNWTWERVRRGEKKNVVISSEGLELGRWADPPGAAHMAGEDRRGACGAG